MILRKARTYLRLKLRIPPPLSTVTLLDREFVVRGGLREKADYDDGWLYALSLRSVNVIDVGSNIGQSALLILLCPNVQHLLMVEPNIEALTVAAENIFRNHLEERVQFKNVLLSDTVSQNVKFWTFGVAAAGSIYSNMSHTATRINSKVTVESTTLDDLCERFAIQPDLIKIDVEGAEVQVLRGAITCAQQLQPKFLVELHARPDLPMPNHAELVLQWCKDCGYNAWFLAQHAQLSDPQMVAHRGRCHLLLLPQTEMYPDYLLSIKESENPTSSTS